MSDTGEVYSVSIIDSHLLHGGALARVVTEQVDTVPWAAPAGGRHTVTGGVSPRLDDQPVTAPEVAAETPSLAFGHPAAARGLPAPTLDPGSQSSAVPYATPALSRPVDVVPSGILGSGSPDHAPQPDTGSTARPGSTGALTSTRSEQPAGRPPENGLAAAPSASPVVASAQSSTPAEAPAPSVTRLVPAVPLAPIPKAMPETGEPVNVATLNRWRQGLIQPREPAPAEGADPPATDGEPDHRAGVPGPDLMRVSAGLESHLPGLGENPSAGVDNCMQCAHALAHRHAGEPPVVLEFPNGNPRDLFQRYGLPERGYGAQVDGEYVLPEGLAFDLDSLQRYLNSLPVGARGIVLVHYNDLGFGHAVLAQVIGGPRGRHAMFLDRQSGGVLQPRALVTPPAGSRPAPASASDISLAFVRTDVVSERSGDGGSPGSQPMGVLVSADPDRQRVLIADPITRTAAWYASGASPGAMDARFGQFVVLPDRSAGAALSTSAATAFGPTVRALLDGVDEPVHDLPDLAELTGEAP